MGRTRGGGPPRRSRQRAPCGRSGGGPGPAAGDGARRVPGRGARPPVVDAGRPGPGGADREPRAQRRPRPARPRGAGGRRAPAGGGRGRRAAGGPPAGPVRGRRHGRPGADRGAAPRGGGRTPDRGRRCPLHGERQRFPLQRRGRGAHPAHAGGPRLRMKARAAVFFFHDIVPADRLAEVPATHRPYVFTPEEFRAYLIAARQAPRRAIPVRQVPTELGEPFYSLTFDDGLASDYTEAFPVLAELGLRATFFVVPTVVGTT